MLKTSLINIDTAKSIITNKKLGLFQEVFWWKIIESGFGKPCKVALISKGGVNQLLIPLFFHRIGFVNRVGSPLRGTFTPYIEFLKLAEDITIEAQNECLEDLINTLIKDGANWIEITNLVNQDEKNNNLNGLGFSSEFASSILLATDKKEADLWEGMQGRSRNLVRKAEKNGLSVRYNEYNLGTIDLFYSMLSVTFSKSGQKPPHSKAFYKLLIKDLLKSNNVIFLSVEKEREVLAMGIFNFNDSEINFVSGTSKKIGNQFGANNLMHWEVIKFASRNKLLSYNFGGLGLPSIDKFKRSFGGIEIKYQRHIWMTPLVRFIFGFFMMIKKVILSIRLRRK